MKPVSGKEFIKILEQHGWKLLRVKGSHHVFGKEGSPVRISVPVHGSSMLKAGLQRHFMKQTGIEEDES
ncbi:MAG: type II toxin-antitoxin system HicA family toxin [Nitrospinae bacterium]|nr:type II toxin-antitoxin system HicA family toxin [Nitrospinota bacterium]